MAAMRAVYVSVADRVDRPPDGPMWFVGVIESGVEPSPMGGVRIELREGGPPAVAETCFARWCQCLRRPAADD